ncbi:hypothetical protein PFMC_05283 [Plasmodium falciparum CAMP/Malaysia]|uniref:Erythrocyte membrane protein 1 n=1 Tax=Plasmodium falciparum (isolate Camp / Malaysia) TaxID=5835 RepID=A0A024X187_PLAFC|nr:hypothetical protein PFMC_05283 [Plasmodium falciparum CAMP/Malaysia]
MAPKGRSTNEIELSARDVLENIGIGIYKEEKKKTETYESDLIGKLSKAEFLDGLYRATGGTVRPGPSHFSQLDYRYHTNNTIYSGDERNPCYGREKNRFSESQEYGCSNIYIKGNENNLNGTACAPPRRRHICDQNLEFLDNPHTDDTDDLLGNVLVTAKYEGESIVKNHPDKKNNGNKSGICTSLARSFADIGDIVRGRDMFKSNEKVEIGLKKVFDKIYAKLGTEGKKYYNDGTGNYVKLREDWWKVNRDQVWKALTCYAPNNANYFIGSGNKSKSFSDHKCGHGDKDVPTNLDYVPQFLRWYDEWAEDFCRIRKIKMDKIKKECRDEKKKKYCSGDGYDCTKTDISRNIFYMDLNCPHCENACSNYTKWIENQKKQFHKQKKKYMNEIDMNTYTSKNENDKKFYENLKNGYSPINTFLELLNNGNGCGGNYNIKNEVNFKNPDKTFGPSGYCEACPIYGVNCTKGKCIPVTENEWNSNNRFPTDTSTKNMSPTQIDMLVNDGIGNAIDNELEKNCTKYGILKGIKKQKWQCQYLNNIDQCKINNVMNSGYFDNKIAFNVLFQRWLRYFVRDHNRLKDKIEVCIKNENINENICIKRCKTNCECVGKWLEKKEAEWDKINQHYNQKKSHYVHTIPYWITGFYEKITFPNDFFKALEDVDTINVLDTLKECQDTHCKIEKIRSIDVDFIKEIISWLQNKITVCKNQHDEDKHEYCCDILPKSVDDDEEDDEEVDEEKEESSQTTKRNISQKGGTKSASCVKGACAIVKGVLQQKSNGSIDNCNAKNIQKNEWQCDKNTFVDGNEGVCMPPRRKSICIHNLTLEEQTKDEDELREAFIKCAAKETNLLWDKYINDKKEEQELFKKGTIPEDFMRIMFYTFGDFRDFCLGNDMGKDVDKVKKNINKVFNNSDKGGSQKIDPENWWQKNGPEIWKGMLCALTNAGGKDTITKNDNYKYEKVTILAKRDGSNGIALSEFAKKPKFLRWFVEWYDEYCYGRQKHYKDMEKTCKLGEQLKCNEECTEKCNEYKIYMKKKKTEWEGQKIYYITQKNGKANGYTEKDAAEYLKSVFTNNSNGIYNVEKDIKPLNNEDEEADKYCGCKKFIKNEQYTKISGQNNCKGLKKLAKDTKKEKSASDIKWIHDDGTYDYRYLRDRGLSSDVFIPPRRQNLCFEGLDNKSKDVTVKVENKEKLLTRLMQVAATEGYNLGQYYKNKEEQKNNADNYSYEVGPCSAMKYSFYDLRDIIVGNDMLEDNNTDTEKNMKKLFPVASKTRGNTINDRKNWWRNNEQCLWKAMMCGYQKGRDNGNGGTINSDDDLKGCENVPQGDDYPVGKDRNEGMNIQFLRWFTEWSEDYCGNYMKELQILKKECSAVNCSKDPNNSEKQKCKTACSNFSKFVEGWKKQYDSQKNKFNKAKIDNNIKNTYKGIENKEAYVFLGEQCKEKCDCIKNKTEHNTYGNDPKGFDTPPKEQKDNCECVLRKKSACANNEVPKGRTQFQMTCDELKNESPSNGNNNTGNNHKETITFSCNKSNLIGLGAQWKKITDDGLYASPRTRQLCLKHLIGMGRENSNISNVSEEQFIKALQKDAYEEGRGLSIYYSKKYIKSIFKKNEDIKKYTHEAMKRSYADYGDLIKGTTAYKQFNEYENITNLLKKVVDSSKSKLYPDVENYEQLWEKYKSDIWNAMLCGYSDGIDSDNNLMKNEELCKLPEIDGENEFLRWFKEWNENFCITQVIRKDKLKNECINYNCSSIKSKKDDIKSKCVKACINYKKFVKESKTQYEDQKRTYNERHNKTNKDIPTFLKDNCSNKNCDCISIKFSSNDNWEESSFDSLDSSDIKNKCECLKLEEESNTTERYISKEDPQYHPKYKGDGKVNYKYEKGKPKALPSIYPLNCAEKVADELRMYAENSLDTNTKLKAQESHGIFKTEQNSTNNISCKILNNTANGKKYTCENNENTFHDKDEWDCNKGTNKLYENDICLPPRRKHMCTKQLENIKTASIKTTDDLLKEVLITAVNEGKRLKQQWEKTENEAQKKKHFLCDAMKYSFADLADIIRGTDIWKGNKEQQKIQERLVKIFRNIYDNLEKGEKEKYKYGTKYQNLRSAWWDAHRKEIWNAMTCSAPDDCFFVKRGKGDGSDIEFLTFSEHKKCGHDKEPPVYDYVPQVLRWITEWSEHFCELQEKNYYLLKEKCTDYIQKDSKSINDSHNIKCNNCKQKCEAYSKFIKKWNSQYINLEKKFKELYDEANSNKNFEELSIIGKLTRRSNNEDENLIQFLQKVNTECNKPNNVDKYIMYTSDCRTVKFSNTIDTNVNKSTADVTHNTINGPSSNLPVVTETNINYALREYAFKIPPEGYDDACKCIGPEPLDRCPENDTTSKYCNDFVTVPECITKTYNDDLHVWNNANVKYSTEINNGVLVPPRRRYLCLTNMITKNYEKEKNAIENFKTDLLQVAYNEGYFLCKKCDKDNRNALSAMKYTFADIADIVKGKDMINNVISTKLRKLLNNNIKPKTPRIWWKYNKAHVWHAMLCGYKYGGGTITNVDCNIPNEEFTDQFLRWFQEWTENFCTGRQKLYDKLNSQCKSAECDTTNGTIGNNCTIACQEYSNYILNKKDEYQSLKYQYDMNYKETKGKNKEAHEFFKNKCNDSKCDCFFNNFLDKNKTWKNTYETLEETLKGKCECKKIEPKISPAKPIEPESPPLGPKPATPLPRLPNDEPINNNILSTTIPLGIALALSSIAFLFLKKKPKSPVDLLRVLDIHKGDYGMPTLKSKNRYIPYVSDTYKGKTYIYMEGDSSGDEKYAFMSDTTDITSSESEYEELDINDIYVPGTPKYKTLIEVVLEPSKSNGNTLGDMVGTTIFTDEEWNELKHDFISQYIQSRLPLDVPQYDVLTDLPMNIGGNVLDDGMDEKPFITSIHDRDLYNGEEISYNINMSTNSMDDPKYVSNNVYSGIDLINDTLSGNQHIDIYDEVLKRKENELYGTNYKKNTSNNSVAKNTNNDPIMNQLDLLHKWLDRHRDMCEKWNTKEELLDKLNEQWNKDNNSGDIPNDNKTLNTDVSIQIDIDENKGKKEFSNMDTILDDMEDDIYYDVNDNDDDNDQPSVYDISMDHNKVDVDVPKKVHIEMKILNNTSNGSLEQQFPISDVWNI